MIALAIIFWVCAAGITFAYVGYPVCLLVAGMLAAREVRRGAFSGSVSLLLAAHNEAGRIAGRRDELVGLLDGAGVGGEVIVVCNGCDDGTAEVARRDADARVKVIEIPENVGKAESLTRGAAAAAGDILVFADARQRWAPEALSRILENFADTRVGGVSGNLMIEAAPGSTAGVGLYWRYEKAVRRLESRIHSSAGATGAISAVRRALFRPIPAGTILDDVYWPMQVVLQGYRVVQDERAAAFDELPVNARDEFRRKVRTLSGNFQLMLRLPGALDPWRNPIWFQFVSHKLLRLAVPWMLVLMLISAAVLGPGFYRAAFGVQVVGYLLAIIGMNRRFAALFRPASAAASFVLLNAAAWMGFWVWLTGRSGRSWHKVGYGAQGPGGG